MKYKLVKGNFKLLKRASIDEAFVVKDNYNFNSQSYLYVHYDDGSQSLYSYPDFNFLEGKNNYDKFRIKKNIKAFYDMNKVISVPSVFRMDFAEIMSDYIKKEELKANVIKQKLGINTSDIHQIYSYYDNGKFKNLWEEYNKLKNLVLKEANKINISYDKDPVLISKEVIKEMMKRPYLDDKTDISNCYSINLIDSEFNNELKSIESSSKYDTFKYDSLSNDCLSKRMFLQRYIKEFFSNEYLLFNALINKRFKDRKYILKTYAEFLIALPYYCSLITKLEENSKRAIKIKINSKLKELLKNKEFSDQVDDIMDHDPELETYYYHAPMDECGAIEIVNNGLYMYSDNVYRTSFEELNKNQVLSYEYGGMFEHLGNYIIIFSIPKHSDAIRELSQEEKNNCNIVPRRPGLIGIKPSYIIDSKFIVGYIDKENCKVVYNQNFEKRTNNFMSM